MPASPITSVSYSNLGSERQSGPIVGLAKCLDNPSAINGHRLVAVHKPPPASSLLRTECTSLTAAPTSNSSQPGETNPNSSCRSSRNRYPQSWGWAHKYPLTSRCPAKTACDDKACRAFACRHTPWCTASLDSLQRFRPSVSSRVSPGPYPSP